VNGIDTAGVRLGTEGEGEGPRIRDSSRYAALLQGLAVQAGFNYRGFQNLGFAAMMLPALRDLYPEPEGLRAAFHRHLDYFNTPPHLAGVAAGALMRDEQRRARGEAGALKDEAQVRLRRALGSLLGSVGDRLVWAGLMPLAVLAGLLAWFHDPLWGAPVVLVLFNIPQLVLRADGLRLGWEEGPEVHHRVGGPAAARLILWARRLAALTAGALAALLVLHPLTPSGTEGLALVAVGAALALLFRRLRIPPALSGMLVAALIGLYCLLTAAA
jgi:mannose/fructose/N-acetylgalactosamine-specific phosphotransferase system component IID